MEHSAQPTAIILPVSIVSPTDVARLAREIEAIDSFFQEQAIRKSGDGNTMPRLSKLMDQLANDNQMNLLHEEDRSKIMSILQKLHASAPILHISFSVDPPGAYVQKIVAWLRENIHHYALVTVGLQPNIGAGCIVRTTNKIFDFSLREFFNQKRDFFVEKLHVAITTPEAMAENAETTPEPADTPETAAPTDVVISTPTAQVVVAAVEQSQQPADVAPTPQPIVEAPVTVAKEATA